MIWLLVSLLQPQAALAGVFNIPQFVNPGEFAIGLEPELTLTSGAGAGVNFKYTQGLNELTNLQGIIGTGGGPRNFRFGGNLTFDFFPDLDKQPGIGISAQGIYYRVTPTDTTSTDGRLEVTGIPYIHKAFISQGSEINPYFAVPLGMAFQHGKYEALSSAVIGTMFKNQEKFRYSIEFGIAINHTESYISGGVTYYH